MTSQTPEQPDIQLRPIRRDNVRQRLALAAAIALITTSCDNQTSSYSPVEPAASNEEIPAVFYTTTEECEIDVQKQQDEYVVLETAFKAGQLAEEPTPPALEVAECEPQMLAAQTEHQTHAPTYASKADCEAEGLVCEPTTQNTGYYRPRFGGYYFYPYSRPSYVYVNYGGSQRQVYEPRTVYQSSTAGQVVTPNGQVVSRSQTGVGKAPAHTQVAAPPRPAGTAAKGTITGRGRQGFGSTFKGTGRGGK